MNRDSIDAGKTKGKFAEAFLLTGGIGAIVYPLVFYWVSFTVIDSRFEYLSCIAEAEMKATLEGEETTDAVRDAVNYNLFMICLYLALHFALYMRPESYDTFKMLGIVFAVVVCLEIVVALILFIVIGVSVCNTEQYGIAAILSSLAILVINGLTLVLGILYFLSKTRVSAGRVGNEMQPL